MLPGLSSIVLYNRDRPINYLYIWLGNVGLNTNNCTLNEYRDSLEKHFTNRLFIVGLSGLEPETSCVSDMHSNQLNYNPIYNQLFQVYGESDI